MHSHLILLLLALAIASISAKNIYPINDSNNFNDEQRDMVYSDEDLNQYARFEELLNYIQNARNHQEERDRYQAIAKRAKSIVKGDPREFMG